MEFVSSRMTSLEDLLKARTQCFINCKFINREFRPSSGIQTFGNKKILSCFIARALVS